MSFPITDFFSVNLVPSAYAVDLLRVEAYQHLNEISSACNLLLAWYKQDPNNLLIKISLSELILSTAPNNTPWLKSLLGMTEHIENESPIHTVLLFYRGIVFENLKLYDCAQNVLSAISRKKKDREDELLLAIQEERAKIFELQGQKSSAKKLWEKIYSEDPSNLEAAKKVQLL